MIELVIFVVFLFIGMVLMFFAMINEDGKSYSNHSSAPRRRTRNRRRSGFFDDDSSREKSSRASGNPFDNHCESSFDWKDKDNDGYDDRNDGFWNEREF